MVTEQGSPQWQPDVYDQNFQGGGGGGEGDSSERCLKWGGGGWGVIKGSFQKHLKTGGGKRQKLFVGGGGFEGVTTPAPPPGKF